MRIFVVFVSKFILHCHVVCDIFNQEYSLNIMRFIKIYKLKNFSASNLNLSGLVYISCHQIIGNALIVHYRLHHYDYLPALVFLSI